MSDHLRTPYYVSALDPTSDAYLSTDSQLPGDDIEPRVVDNTDRANAWSSESRYDSDTHYPCFDVDRELIFGQRLVLDLMFPGHRKVPSTTPGHFHVYHDEPMKWGDYFHNLNTLVECDIVEPGYRDAALSRKATFVRMPHVKKRKVVDDE